ncbi:MAG: phosphomannomutase/phosphoglucomutase [Candidatus Endobugula sp.]|jgi:phosphomannomutase/phosphoglucomutase
MMMKTAVSRLALHQLLSIMLIIALLSGVVTYYAAWWWVTKPQNQQRFSQYVEQNVDTYNKSTEDYLSSLKVTLTSFADEVPDDVFVPNIVLPSVLQVPTDAPFANEPLIVIDNQPLIEKEVKNASKEWLDERRLIWQEALPEAKNFMLFSVAEIEKISESLLTDSTHRSDMLTQYGVNFLFLDMVNRLNDQELLYTEAAKVTGTHQWRLHHLVAITDAEDNIQGVLYTTLGLQGLHKTWGSINTSLGKIALLQKVEQGAPLAFFSVGQASTAMRSTTQNIRNSHWHINYQPSLELQKNTEITPTWVWFITIGLPFLILCFGTLLVFRAPEKRKKKDTRNGTTKNVPDIIEKSEPISELAKVESNEVSTENNIVEKISNVSSVEIKVTSVSSAKDEKAESHFPENIFRAYDIRGIAYEELSHDVMYAVGQAFATEVLLAGETSAVVAWDARTHSQEFSVCLLKGIHSTGCDTIAIGVVPTPLMNFTACEHANTSSGIIITASHNPKEYNGCKMVVKGRTLVDGDIQRIKERIQQGDVTVADDQGVSTTEDFSQKYIDRIISDVAVIDGWKVVVDAANGASSELAPRLMNALQCKTHPLYCQFDGEFPNHEPDPSVAKNLTSLIETVKAKKADIGFALDGDGDRLTAVTASGKIVWPDQLMMLFSQDIVARNPGCDVVFDVKSTQLLAQVISENGGRPVMWKTGHSHIKAKMHETQALLGGEFSGHIFFKERWYGFDDGLYAAARLLELLTLAGQTLDELVDALPSRSSTPEIKLATTEEQKFIFIEQLIAKAEFPDGQRTTIDGLRVDFANGWGLVRASNTAPVLTLRFEAVDEEELEKIKQQFKNELIKIDSTLELNF